MVEVSLCLDRVSRSYPRDISDTPSAILREMFCPYFFLKKSWPETFFALQNINFRLAKGQKMGVIGAHRSGKTTLAGVASGVLQPTEGSVTAIGERLLISRPAAGFKPTLTSLENLRLRAALVGVGGKILDASLDNTLSSCGVSYAEAMKPMGNLSPHKVKQLGLTLLLELPCDILVVDEITNAGTGDSRWITRGLLQEKISSKTALVISADFGFIKDAVEFSLLLHRGRIYGPFGVEEAIGYYNRLPQDEDIRDMPDSEYDANNPPTISNKAPNYDLIDQLLDRELGVYTDPDLCEQDVDNIYNEDSSFGERRSLLNDGPLWKILSIKVDGEEFSRSLFCLIRKPGDILNVSIEMVSLHNQNYSGGRYSIFSGNSGMELGEFYDKRESIFVPVNKKVVLSFDLKISDWGGLFYGLAFCPEQGVNNFPLNHRMKILIFGLGKKNVIVCKQTLEIDKICFESLVK